MKLSTLGLSSCMDMCRICLEDKTDTSADGFVDIFSPQSAEYNEKVDQNDGKSKSVCGSCHTIIMKFLGLTEKYTESQIVINYLVKRLSTLPKANSKSSYAKSKLSNTKSKLLNAKSSNSPHSYLGTPKSSDSISKSENNKAINNSNGNEPLSSSFMEMYIREQKFLTCFVPNCNYVFKGNSEFLFHCETHMGSTDKALVLLKRFYEISNEDIDITIIHIQEYIHNILKCFTCDIYFENISGLAHHKLEVHNANVRNNDGDIICMYCQKVFTREVKFKTHIKQCSVQYKPSERLNGLNCNLSSFNENTCKINQEIRESTTESNFSKMCNTCNEICNSKAALENHLKNHSIPSTSKAMRIDNHQLYSVEQPEKVDTEPYRINNAIPSTSSKRMRMQDKNECSSNKKSSQTSFIERNGFNNVVLHDTPSTSFSENIDSPLNDVSMPKIVRVVSLAQENVVENGLNKSLVSKYFGI